MARMVTDIGIEIDAHTTADGGASFGIGLAGTLPVRFVDGAIVGTATDDSVRGLATARLRHPRLGTLDARAALTWDARGLRAEAVEFDAGVWTASGDAALVLAATDLFPSGESTGRPPMAERIASAELRGELSIDGFDLASLPPTWTGIPLLEGRLEAAVKASGTVANPALRGRLGVTDGRAKVARAVPVLDRVRIEATIDEDAVRIVEAAAALGIGSIQFTGSATMPEGRPLWSDWRQLAVDARVTAEDALLVRTTGRKIRTDGEITARGTFADGYDVAGRVVLEAGKIVERISLVPDFGTRGGTGLSTGIDLPSIPAPFGERIRYDVQLDSNEPLAIAAYVLDTELDIAARLRGTGAEPHLEGAVSSQSGVLRLPALALDLERVVVNFRPQDPRHPLIEATATGRRHGIDITARAEGPLDRVEILVNSSPPLTQQELYVLVTTGVMPDTLRRQGLQGRATMVGGYLAQEIVDFYFGSDSTERGPTLVDRFHFYSGQEISRNGVESLTVDFDLVQDETFALRGERDIYEDYNMGLVWRLRF